jgi:hypothetical protein
LSSARNRFTPKVQIGIKSDQVPFIGRRYQYSPIYPNFVIPTSNPSRGFPEVRAVHKHIFVRFVAPVAALGLLAFGSSASGAEAGVKVASANPPRHTAPAPAPSQKPQPAVEKSEPLETAGTVSGPMVHVRSGPGTHFGVLTTLKQGDAVKIESTQSGWLTIAWPESAPLWIAKEGVQLKGTGAEREGTLKAASTLRNSASNKAETVTKLEPGAKLTVL